MSKEIKDMSPEELSVFTDELLSKKPIVIKRSQPQRSPDADFFANVVEYTVSVNLEQLEDWSRLKGQEAAMLQFAKKFFDSN